MRLLEAGYSDFETMGASAGNISGKYEIAQRNWPYSTYAYFCYTSQRPKDLHVAHDRGFYNETFLDIGSESEVETGSYYAIVGANITSNNQDTIGGYVFLSHEVVIADQRCAIPPCVESTANNACSDQVGSQKCLLFPVCLN